MNKKWVVFFGTVLVMAASLAHAQTEGESICPLPVVVIDDILAWGWPQVDTDNDGLLSYPEIKDVYSEVDVVWFASMDSNGDGKLSQEELTAEIPEGDIVPQLDQNGDRLIQDVEVAEYISLANFESLDANSNGVVDCEDLELLGITPHSDEGEGEEGETVEGEGEPVEGEPMTEEEVIAVLFEEFYNADANRDNVLSFDEALGVLPGLTREQFDDIDVNGSGFLSIEELGGREGRGCRWNLFSTKDIFKQCIGDWLLIGLSVMSLLTLAAR